MTTDENTVTWITYSKVTVGMLVKSAGSGTVWSNRAQAEKDVRPFKQVAEVVRVNRFNMALIYTDGTRTGGHTPSAKILVAG